MIKSSRWIAKTFSTKLHRVPNLKDFMSSEANPDIEGSLDAIIPPYAEHFKQTSKTYFIETYGC
jgi:hypothetical protein